MELTKIDFKPADRNQLPKVLEVESHTLLFASGFIDYSTIPNIVERGRIIYQDWVHLGLHQSAISDAHRQQVDNAYITYLKVALKGCET